MVLTKEEIHNILVFMERTKLTGAEVQEYCNLYNKLRQMEKEEAENVTDG